MTGVKVWVVAGLLIVAAAGAAGWGLWSNAGKNAQIDGLKAALASEQARADALASAAEKDAAALKDLQDKLAAMEKARQPAVAGASNDGALINRMMQAMLAQGFGGEKDIKKSDWVGNIVAGVSGMVRSKEGREIALILADFMSESWLESMLGDKALAADKAQKARDIISRNIQQDVDAVLGLFNEKFDLKKAYDTIDSLGKDPAVKRMRRELEGVVEPDMLAAWDQQRTSMKESGGQNFLEGALTMSLPELTPENRIRMAQIMNEEMQAAQEARPQFSFANLLNIPSTMEAYMAEDQATMTRVSEKLAQETDAEQMKYVEQFMRENQRSNDISLRLVNVLFGKTKQ